MVLNAKTMGCGNCGHGLFRMFKSVNDDNLNLVAECNSCKATSIIGVNKPQIYIDFGEESDGRLCEMTPRF